MYIVTEPISLSLDPVCLGRNFAYGNRPSERKRGYDLNCVNTNKYALREDVLSKISSFLHQRYLEECNY